VKRDWCSLRRVLLLHVPSGLPLTWSASQGKMWASYGCPQHLRALRHIRLRGSSPAISHLLTAGHRCEFALCTNKGGKHPLGSRGGGAATASSLTSPSSPNPHFAQPGSHNTQAHSRRRVVRVKALIYDTIALSSSASREFHKPNLISVSASATHPTAFRTYTPATPTLHTQGRNASVTDTTLTASARRRQRRSTRVGPSHVKDRHDE
jgi:hypothetical protein